MTEISAHIYFDRVELSIKPTFGVVTYEDGTKGAYVDLGPGVTLHCSEANAAELEDLFGRVRDAVAASASPIAGVKPE